MSDLNTENQQNVNEAIPQQNGTAAEPAKKTGPKFLEKLPGGKFGNFIRKSWIAIIVVVCAVLVLAVGGKAIMSKLAPGASLAKSMANTTKAIGARMDESPYAALYLLGEAALNGEIDVEFTYFDDWSDVFGNVTVKTDTKNMAFGLDGSMTYDGQKLDATGYLDKECLVVGSSILEENMGITFASFENDLRKSYLGDELSDDEIDEICTVIQSLQDAFSMKDGELEKALLAEIEAIEKQLKAVSGSEKIEMSGETISCTTTSYTIDEKLIHDVCMNIAEILYADDAILNAMAMQYTGYGVDEEEAREMAEDACADLLEDMDDMLSELEGDMEITYYVYKNMVVRMAINGEFEYDYEELAIDYTVDFGKNPAKDDWTITMEVEVDGESVEVSGTYSTISDGDTYEDSFRAKVKADGMSQTMTLKTDWDKKSGDLRFRLSGDGPTGSFSCNLKTEKDGFTLKLDDFAEMLYDEEAYLELIITSTTGTKLTKPSFRNLDAWDEDFIDSVEAAFEEAGLPAGRSTGYAATPPAYSY